MELADLDSFRRGPSLPSDYPAGLRRFYTHQDDVHGVLVELLASVTRSLTVCMFGYDDDQLNTRILGLLANPNVLVTVTLDKSQAGGVHERALLAADTQWVGNSISIGTSPFGHQIMHEKGLCVDGRFTVGGSTNWSSSGEGADAKKKQANECTVYDSRAVAFEFEAQASALHRYQLAQMAAAAVREPR